MNFLNFSFFNFLIINLFFRWILHIRSSMKRLTNKKEITEFLLEYNCAIFSFYPPEVFFFYSISFIFFHLFRLINNSEAVKSASGFEVLKASKFSCFFKLNLFEFILD